MSSVFSLRTRADDGLVHSSSTVRRNPCRGLEITRWRDAYRVAFFFRWDELGEEKGDGGCERFSLFAASQAEKYEVAILLMGATDVVGTCVAGLGRLP